MSYEVILLRSAQKEFNTIVDWLAARSQSGTLSWLTAYEHVIERLEREPDGFGLAPENEFVSYTIQQSLFQTRYGRTYRVLFTLVGQQVRVLHLRGPGQDAVQFDS